MRTMIQLPPFAQTVLVLAAAVVVVAGIRAISDIAGAFLMAGLIAVLAIPFEEWLQRRGVRKMVAFGITFLICVAVVFGVVLFFAIAAQQVARSLISYEDQLREWIAWGEGQLTALGVSVNDLPLDSISADNVIQVVQSVANLIFDSASSVLLIFLFLLYFLMEGDDLAIRIERALGPTSPTILRLRTFLRSAQQYLLFRTLFGAVIAALQTTLMLIMGVDFAILWGVLSFVANFIPNVGFIFGLIPPAVLLLVEQGPVPTVIFIALYSLINNVFENLIAPRTMGQQVNLSPLTTFLSLTLWAWVLGAAGAFLAVPLTLFVKIVLLEADPEYRGLVSLMSADTPPPAPDPAKAGP
ncbi:MAG: AI-2E family transporter [Chloroflexi bacterium]|nr:AI-2E family transporter [Chloroflexota bacterium]